MVQGGVQRGVRGGVRGDAHALRTHQCSSGAAVHIPCIHRAAIVLCTYRAALLGLDLLEQCAEPLVLLAVFLRGP